MIFLPLVISFLWLNSTIAKEIWNRRRPIEVRGNSPNNCIIDDQSMDKKTTETNTMSNDITAGKSRDGKPYFNYSQILVLN